MAPEQSSVFARPASTKNQRQDLLSQLESFQTSLRTSNANAFKTQIEAPPRPFFASNSQGLESLEKSLSTRMRSFQQVLLFIALSFWPYSQFSFAGSQEQHRIAIPPQQQISQQNQTLSNIRSKLAPKTHRGPLQTHPQLLGLQEATQRGCQQRCVKLL